MLHPQKTTRKYVFNWIGIWLALMVTALFCRPLLPFHELSTAAISWEMWVSEQYWVPTLNGNVINESYLLIHWLEILIWKIAGVSEFSIRFLASLFSLGTLFFTALAARQLWPELPKVRANAPLILIGSLMWAVFSTAHIEQVFITFFLLLYINFVIRAWKYSAFWWIAVAISLLLGLFVTGISFLIYALPVLLMFPLWLKKYGQQYLFAFLALVTAYLIFWGWGYWVKSQYPYVSLNNIMGLPRFIAQINDPVPFGVTVLSLIIVLFPWVFWLPLYRSLSHVDKSEQSFRFCLTWLLSSLVIVLITMKSSIVPLIPIYPAFCLLIARIYQSTINCRKDIILVVLVIAFLGVLLLVLPFVKDVISDTNALAWLSTISPYWGGGLLLFAMMLFIYAKETKLITLALMSVALTIAFNFGVIRNARDYYDVLPASERVHWYQGKGYTLAHNGRYMGQYHFMGRLQKPLVVIKNEKDFVEFKTSFPKGRVVVYLDKMTPDVTQNAEYYQPFRNRYLAIFAVEDIDNLSLLVQ